MNQQQKDLILRALDTGSLAVEFLQVKDYPVNWKPEFELINAAIKELEAMPTEEEEGK
jgi:hypothetical protein